MLVTSMSPICIAKDTNHCKSIFQKASNVNASANTYAKTIIRALIFKTNASFFFNI